MLHMGARGQGTDPSLREEADEVSRQVPPPIIISAGAESTAGGSEHNSPHGLPPGSQLWEGAGRAYNFLPLPCLLCWPSRHVCAQLPACCGRPACSYAWEGGHRCHPHHQEHCQYSCGCNRPHGLHCVTSLATPVYVLQETPTGLACAAQPPHNLVYKSGHRLYLHGLYWRDLVRVPRVFPASSACQTPNDTRSLSSPQVLRRYVCSPAPGSLSGYISANAAAAVRSYSYHPRRAGSTGGRW